MARTDSPLARDFDVVIVGSGAGGSAAAYSLVRAGLRVALVEKGVRLPRDGSTLDVQRVVHDGEFRSHEEWRDRHGRALVPEEYFNLGGKTKWYGAALARFRPAEFGPDEKHECRGWPIGYGDLAPYYDEVERLLGVRRFECEPDLASLIGRLRARSPHWRAEALPLGLSERIVREPHEAAHFDGFASPLGLKADADVKLLGGITSASNLTLLLGRAVVTLVGAPKDPRRIAGVQLADGTVLRARAVVLAAGAMHSARLLERYLNIHRLSGLPAAASVGRNFKLHLLTAVLAVSPGMKTDLLRKTTLLLDDRTPHSSVQALGFDAELIATLIPRYVPRRLARVIGERAYGFFLQTEDGSHPDNRVRGAGPDGDHPRLDYDAARIPAARAEHRTLIANFRRDLLRAGYVTFAQRVPLSGTAHACGTLVAGSDPRSSVVDAVGRVHGLEGLTVVDGSVLPRSSRVNPALTIYAWSLRAAEKLAQRLGASRSHLRDAATVVAALAE
jgi:choline dehydrogenase-like flavoprotein